MNIKVFDFGASLNLSKSPLVYLIPPPNTLQVQLRQTQTMCCEHCVRCKLPILLQFPARAPGVFNQSDRSNLSTFLFQFCTWDSLLATVYLLTR
jgi:hypothetical protein